MFQFMVDGNSFRNHAACVESPTVQLRGISNILFFQNAALYNVLSVILIHLMSMNMNVYRWVLPGGIWILEGLLEP